MKRNMYRIIVILLMVLLMGVSSYASDDYINPTVTMSSLTSNEAYNIKATCKNINDSLVYEELIDSAVTIISSKKVDGKKDGEIVENVEFNLAVYKRLSQKDKERVMSIILNGIDNSDLSRISKTKIYNFVSNSDSATSNLVRQLSNDVKADFASAYSSFKPFTGVIGWILGCITIGIFMLLGVTITIDIAFIVIPFVQIALSKVTKKEKPALISPEAWNAIKAAEQSVGSGYREPLGLYFKMKTKQFLALGICLLYLISGQIYSLIAMVIDLFNGIVQ